MKNSPNQMDKISLSDILVCVTNHNNNDNALELKHALSPFLCTLLIDSGSKSNEGFDVKLDNVYYSGLFNESVARAKQLQFTYLLFVASDVLINSAEMLVERIVDLPKTVGVWSPSASGQAVAHCKNGGSGGLREVPYCEGYFFLAKVAVLETFTPVPLNENLYGFGIDLLTGYECRKSGFLVVCDDRITIHHTEGTGYPSIEASTQMWQWLSGIGKLKALELLPQKDFKRIFKRHTSRAQRPVLLLKLMRKLLTSIKNPDFS